MELEYICSNNYYMSAIFSFPNREIRNYKNQVESQINFFREKEMLIECKFSLERSRIYLKLWYTRL